MITWTTASIALFLLSLVLNAFVDWLHIKTNGNNPYTWLLVVIGVTYTVGTALLLDYGKYPVGDQWFVHWQTLFICFCISGFPMVVGDIIRTLQGR